MDQLDAGKLRGGDLELSESAEFKNRSDRFGVTALNSEDESAFGIRAFVNGTWKYLAGKQGWL